VCSDVSFSEEYIDPLIIVDRHQERTESLRGLLSGIPTFLVCGGPSAKELDLSKIEAKGIWSMAVNNMAGHFSPSSFVCSDPPSKFHNGIWQDPRVMKIIPIPKMKSRRGRLRKKVDGKIEPLMKPDGNQMSTSDCPNLWGFERRSWMAPDDTFFLEDSAAWGNHNAGVDRTGESKTVCTMLLAIRLLYYLGSRRIYLVGVDFNMDQNANLKDNYAFGQNRDQGACSSNNSQ